MLRLRYAISGADLGSASAVRCEAVCASYAVCGTDLGYAAFSRVIASGAHSQPITCVEDLNRVLLQVNSAICLRAGYAVCSTEIADCVMCGTEIGRGSLGLIPRCDWFGRMCHGMCGTRIGYAVAMGSDVCDAIPDTYLRPLTRLADL
eukprot:1330005-Rhodomonas_salina.1